MDDLENISEELKALSERLYKKLLVSRKVGNVTPDHPIMAKDICERLKTNEHIIVSDIDVRQMINHQRSLGRWIATGKSGVGYYLALTPGEMEYTLKRLRRIRDSVERPIAGIERSFQKELEL